MRRLGREALVLAGFLAFAVYATWPLATNMFSGFSDRGDSYLDAWMLWWVKEQGFSLHNPYYTGHMLAPVGSYLAYGGLMPLAGVVLAPITALFGAGVARNLASLAVPVAASYVTYRLGMRIGLVRCIALITGGLYGFSTLLIMRAAYHLNLGAGLIFAPLALLCAVRYYQRPTWRNAVGLGGTLGMAVLVDQTTAMYACVLAMGFLAAVHLQDRVHPRKWYRALALATVTGILVATPQLLMTFKQDTVDTPTHLASMSAGFKSYNASILAMASPSPSLRLAPWQINEIVDRSGDESGELPAAFGWGLLGLAGAGIVLARRRRLAVGLFVAFVVSALLAMGPELTLSSHPQLPLPITYGGSEMSGLMPYTWVVRIPGLYQLHVASRFTLLALLPATLLAGIGLQALWGRGRGGQSLAVVLVALAVLEAGYPVTRGDRQVPLTRDELYAPVKAQEGDSILVDVPLGFTSGVGGIGDPRDQEGLFRATEHGHRVASAYLSRVPLNRMAAQIGHRFYTDLIVQQGTDYPQLIGGETPFSICCALKASGGHLAGLFPPPDPEVGRADAREMGVGWVVIWPEASAEVRRYIRAVGFRLEHKIDGIALYRAPWGHTDGG
jgi:hypothetical protein